MIARLFTSVMYWVLLLPLTLFHSCSQRQMLLYASTIILHYYSGRINYLQFLIIIINTKTLHGKSRSVSNTGWGGFRRPAWISNRNNYTDNNMLVATINIESIVYYLPVSYTHLDVYKRQLLQRSIVGTRWVHPKDWKQQSTHLLFQA